MCSRRTVVFFFGPPGAGKGSLSDLLKETQGFVKISSGDLLRSRMKGDDDLGRLIRQSMEDAGLVSDEIINTLLDDFLKTVPADSSVVIDGYPQNHNQWKNVKNIETFLEVKPIFVEMRIQKDQALKRIASRKICGQCSKVYTLQDVQCAICRVPLILRDDDVRHGVAERRIDYYESKVRPLLRHIQEVYPVITLSADAEFVQVSHTLLEQLQLITNSLETEA